MTRRPSLRTHRSTLGLLPASGPWPPLATALGFALVFAACAAESDGPHDWPDDCPSPNLNGVNYMHPTWAQRGVCAKIDFDCDEGELFISQVTEAECGCGCITKAACRASSACEMP